MRWLFVFSAGAALALVAVAACTAESYDYGSSQDLGDPNLLFLPPDAGPTATVEGGASGACTPDRYIDAASCPVSFRRDIYAAKMLEGGPWNCASAVCHGGATPSNKPPIDGVDASAAYGSLVAYTLVTNPLLHYVNPCSTDLAASGFACNMHFTCGSGGGMPLGMEQPDADLTQLETWIACGAPNN